VECLCVPHVWRCSICASSHLSGAFTILYISGSGGGGSSGSGAHGRQQVHESERRRSGQLPILTCNAATAIATPPAATTADNPSAVLPRLRSSSSPVH
jgi:hypothetical protein